jgi:integron integrase
MNISHFDNYLKNNPKVQKSQISYLKFWVNRCLQNLGFSFGTPLQKSHLSEFIASIEGNSQAWQIDQAKEALQLYIAFISINSDTPVVELTSDWQKAIGETANLLRVSGKSIRTAQAYLFWIKAFAERNEAKQPTALTEEDYRNFIDYLSHTKNVAATTQNQAHNALNFFYVNYLKHTFTEPLANIRAKRREKLPIVLTQSEVSDILRQLKGRHRIMAMMLYGSGLRLQECLELRIKDVDFEKQLIIVRSTHGDDFRLGLLPDFVIDDLQHYVSKLKEQFYEDRKNGLAGVELPEILEKIYPSAGKEWEWYWLFPSNRTTEKGRLGLQTRSHIHPSSLQRAFQKALKKSGIIKPVSLQTLRHSFAVHLLEQGYDAKAVQKLLGHANIQSTMIYAHIAEKDELRIRSPLDALIL